MADWCVRCIQTHRIINKREILPFIPTILDYRWVRDEIYDHVLALHRNKIETETLNRSSLACSPDQRGDGGEWTLEDTVSRDHDDDSEYGNDDDGMGMDIDEESIETASHEAWRNRNRNRSQPQVVHTPVETPRDHTVQDGGGKPTVLSSVHLTTPDSWRSDHMSTTPSEQSQGADQVSDNVPSTSSHDHVDESDNLQMTTGTICDVVSPDLEMTEYDDLGGLQQLNLLEEETDQH